MDNLHDSAEQNIQIFRVNEAQLPEQLERHANGQLTAERLGDTALSNTLDLAYVTSEEKDGKKTYLVNLATGDRLNPQGRMYRELFGDADLESVVPKSEIEDSKEHITSDDVMEAFTVAREIVNSHRASRDTGRVLIDQSINRLNTVIDREGISEGTVSLLKLMLAGVSDDVTQKYGLIQEAADRIDESGKLALSLNSVARNTLEIKQDSMLNPNADMNVADVLEANLGATEIGSEARSAYLAYGIGELFGNKYAEDEYLSRLNRVVNERL